MKIIYSLTLVGFIATSTNSAALSQVQGGFIPLIDQALANLHIGILDTFIKNHCRGNVRDARRVWNALPGALKHRVMNTATNFARSVAVDHQQFCNYLHIFEVISEQLEIVSILSQRYGPPSRMISISRPSAQAFISEKCQGVQMPLIIFELKLAISSFAESNPDKAQIEHFCHILGGRPKAKAQHEIATEISQLNPKPNLMVSGRYPRVEDFISERCDGVQMTDMIQELQLAISSFAVSKPDKAQIARFCEFLGGRPKAGASSI